MTTNDAGLRPCRSPYCECVQGQCTHPGCYDARGEADTMANGLTEAETSATASVVGLLGGRPAQDAGAVELARFYIAEDDALESNVVTLMSRGRRLADAVLASPSEYDLQVAEECAFQRGKAAGLKEGSENAARYAVLRRGGTWRVIDWAGRELRNEHLDAAIDKATRVE